MKLMIRLINGEAFEQTVKVDSFIIGRSTKCTVVIPHEGVSRQHVQVDIVDGTVYIMDLNSTNGVIIDGKKIPPNQQIPYPLYYDLAFGAVENLQMEFESSGATRFMTPDSGGLSQYNASANEHKQDAATSRQELTQGKGVNAGKKNARKTVGTKKEKNESFGRMAVNIMVFLFLAAVGYYFYSTKDERATAQPKTRSGKGGKTKTDDYF